MRVRDIMKTDFWYFAADDNLEYVLKTFTKLGIYEAPVVAEGRFIGIISDREIAAALLKKGMFSFFSKKEIIDRSRLGFISAGKIANRRQLTLREDDQLADVLDDLSQRRADTIPVLREGKLVGIVDGGDVMRHLLLELAKESVSEEFAPGELKSVVDAVASIVRERKKVTAEDIAKKLGLPTQKVEKIALSLQEHHLVEISYSFFGKMVLRERNA